MSSREVEDRVVSLEGGLPMAPPAGGEPWVRWLLQSVRSRCEVAAFAPGQAVGAKLTRAWKGFTDEVFFAHAAPQMILAWQAVVQRDREALITLDLALEKMAPPAARRSRAAGAVLLRNTRGARYQGILGHYRTDVEAGTSPGHLALVWTVIGHFFHLSLTQVLAEYLRLEWEMATREVPHPPEPAGQLSFASLVTTSLGGQQGKGLDWWAETAAEE